MKKKLIKVQEDSVLYVGIKNPTDVRKALLESLRELLCSLKQYEHIRTLRTQKTALFAQYTAQITTIKTLISRLQRTVPKHDVARMTTLTQKVAPVAEVLPAKTPVTPRTAKAPTQNSAAMDEVARLEAELSAIEQKLSNL